ncbi:MAG: hypothetical protein ABIA59_03700 [Candidatus Latescibacterota bacterium]
MNDKTRAPLPTEFAPAGRHTKNEMRTEAEIVQQQMFSSPFIQQLINRAFSTKGNDRGWGAYSIKLITEQYLDGEVSFISSAEEGTTFKARYPHKLSV